MRKVKWVGQIEQTNAVGAVTEPVYKKIGEEMLVTVTDASGA